MLDSNGYNPRALDIANTMVHQEMVAFLTHVNSLYISTRPLISGTNFQIKPILFGPQFLRVVYDVINTIV